MHLSTTVARRCADYDYILTPQGAGGRGDVRGILDPWILGICGFKMHFSVPKTFVIDEMHLYGRENAGARVDNHAKICAAVRTKKISRKENHGPMAKNGFGLR